MDTVTVDENGEVEIPNETVIGRTQDLFGPKIYEITTDLQAQVKAIAESPTAEHIETLTEAVKAHIRENVVAPAAEGYGARG